MRTFRFVSRFRLRGGGRWRRCPVTETERPDSSPWDSEGLVDSVFADRPFRLFPRPGSGGVGGVDGVTRGCGVGGTMGGAAAAGFDGGAVACALFPAESCLCKAARISFCTPGGVESDLCGGVGAFVAPEPCPPSFCKAARTSPVSEDEVGAADELVSVFVLS